MTRSLAAALALLGIGCLAEPTFEGRAASEEAAACELPGWTDEWAALGVAPCTRAGGCAPEPIGPEPVGLTTRYPILFIHGFNSSRSDTYGWNPAILEALQADAAWGQGTDAPRWVFAADLPPFDSVEVRAEELAWQIDALLSETGAEKVNLVGHSMGALDARHAVSVLGYGDRVASITSISGTHRGSALADLALSLLPAAWESTLNSLVAWWASGWSDLAATSDLRATFESLATANAEAFAAAHPDDPRVCNQSFAGVSELTGAEAASACEGKFIGIPGTEDDIDWRLMFFAGDAPGDGMVDVDSARWGRFRGCVPMDHLDAVGQVGDVGPDEDSGFDAIRFYRNVADDLALRGL